MFFLDVPTVPPQNTPIVLVQAAAAGITPQPDYILNACTETPSTGDPRSAMRGVDPAYMLANYLNSHSSKQVVFDLTTIKTTLLQGTQHGKIFSEVDNLGLTSYHYDPIPNYIGNDRAVFLAQFEGKVYKIVINLVVTHNVDESPLFEGEEPVCPPPKLIKVTKPSSGRSNHNLNAITVSYQPNPALKRDAAEARRPLALRWHC